MSNIELALVVPDQGEDLEKAITALLQCGLGPVCCSSAQEDSQLSEEVLTVVVRSDISPGDIFERAQVRKREQLIDLQGGRMQKRMYGD